MQTDNTQETSLVELKTEEFIENDSSKSPSGIDTKKTKKVFRTVVSSVILLLTCFFVYIIWILPAIQTKQDFTKNLEEGKMLSDYNPEEEKTANTEHYSDLAESNSLHFRGSESFNVRVDYYSEETRESLVTLLDIDSGKEYQITDKLPLSAHCVLFNNNEKTYAFFDCGSSPSRTLTVLSLISTKQVLPNFKVLAGQGRPIFWNEYLVYCQANEVEEINNRPWEGGHASSIKVVNIETAKAITLYESDATTDYWLNKIENDKLYITKKTLMDHESYIENWPEVEYVLSEEMIVYDLNQLRR